MKLDTSDIFEVLMTKQQADRLVDILDTLSQSTYTLKSSFLKRLDTVFPLEIRDGLRIFFEKNNIDTKNGQKLQVAITELSRLIQTLPIVKMRLAYEPTYNQMKTIIDNIELYTKGKVLVLTMFEPELIGGAIVEYNGKYGDYSLRNRMLINQEAKETRK